MTSLHGLAVTVVVLLLVHAAWRTRHPNRYPALVAGIGVGLGVTALVSALLLVRAGAVVASAGPQVSLVLVSVLAVVCIALDVRRIIRAVTRTDAPMPTVIPLARERRDLLEDELA